MVSKRKVTADSPAPVAIIDGTHLILLPKSGSSKEINGGHIVPALPLKVVPSLIGKTIFNMAGETFASEWEEGSEEHTIERIRLDATDLIDDTSIIRPITVTMNGKAGCVRIYSEQGQQHNLAMSRSDDNKLDVHLSCSLDSLCGDHRMDSFDDARIYGDNIDDLLHDYGASSQVETTKPCFEIFNAGSCLVADFLGLGGHQQVLLMPLLDDDVSKDLQDNETDDEEMFQESCNNLKRLLQNSVLADGHHVLLSEGSKQPVTTARNNHAISLSTVSLSDLSTEVIKRSVSSDVYVEPMDINSTNDVSEDGRTTKDPLWLDAIRKTIEHRISKKQNETFQTEKSNQVCQDLVTCGRETLHRSIRGGFDTNNNLHPLDTEGPHVLRLRYGMQPRSSIESTGISVAMDLEIDVYLPEPRIPDDHISDSIATRDAEEQSSCKSIVINDFYVSCLLSKDEESSAKQTTKLTCERIRTASGLVPALHTGECVTILASVYFSNINMRQGDSSKPSYLEVLIQGCWINKAFRAQTNSVEAQNRHGTILCSLQLSEESVHLSAPNNSSLYGGRCIHNEINFVGTSSDKTKYVPKAMFEYREPHSLSVDITSSAATLQDPKTWKDLVSYLNDRIGVSSHIDLYWKKGDPCFRLSVFGSNHEERAGKCCVILLFSLWCYHVTRSEYYHVYTF